MEKLPRYITVFLFSLYLISTVVQPQETEDEFPPIVTNAMFQELQSEVNNVNTRIVTVQNQIQGLAERIQNLASQPTTKAPPPMDASGLQALVDVSRKQEEDITKLFYANGVWQQNFKVINITFEKLRKVVLFQTPVMNLPTSNALNRKGSPTIKNGTTPASASTAQKKKKL